MADFLADSFFLSIFILIGTGLSILAPFVDKLLKGKLVLSDFDKNYIVSALVAAVWSWFFLEGIYLQFEPGDVGTNFLWLIALGLGFAGERGQQMAVRIALTLQGRRQAKLGSS
jgi:hypothetical protein